MGVLRAAPQRVALLLKEKAKTVKYRILMTHPDFSKWREKQETRPEGSIGKEILESTQTLTTDWGISEDGIRFYQGAPTVFMLFTPERMLLNPYPYGAEAFKTFTLEVARTENPEDIYTQYVLNHFEHPWSGRNTVPWKQTTHPNSPKRG
jgi:hypothetical protein